VAAKAAVLGVLLRAVVAAADTNLAAATAAARAEVKAATADKKVVRVVASNGKHSDETLSYGLCFRNDMECKLAN
jgi:hypothetical protein